MKIPANLTRVEAGVYRHTNGTQIVRKDRSRIGRTGYALPGWAIIVDGREVLRESTLKRAADEVEIAARSADVEAFNLAQAEAARAENEGPGGIYEGGLSFTTATAAERCEHCGRSIWADQEQEVFVDGAGEADCAAAPMVTNPAGAQYPDITGVHEPA